MDIIKEIRETSRDYDNLEEKMDFLKRKLERIRIQRLFIKEMSARREEGEVLPDVFSFQDITDILDLDEEF